MSKTARPYTREDLAQAEKAGATARRTLFDREASTRELSDSAYWLREQVLVAQAALTTARDTSDAKAVATVLVCLRRYCDEFAIDFAVALEQAQRYYGAYVIEQLREDEANR